MSTFRMPTEVIDLPSRGKFYSPEHPLASGKVEIKYPGAKEEDILTNDNFIEKGIVFNKLLESVIVTKFEIDDILIGDKDQLMVALRILGYGKNYKISYLPAGKKAIDAIPATIDLTKLKEKQIDWDLVTQGKNEFDFFLPACKITVTFKILTHGDETKISEEIDSLKKLSPDLSKEVSTRLKYMIVAVDGNRDPKSIRDFVDNVIPSRDILALREHVNKVSPGVDFTATGVTDKGEVVEDLYVPMTVEFFWPKSAVPDPVV